MHDEGVREGVRLRDSVGAERDDRRGLEHADRCGRRGNDQRQAAGDDGEKPGARGEVEIEPEHDHPEAGGEHEPRDERPEESDEAVAHASEPDEALHQVADGRLHPLREEKWQAGERTQDEAQRALPVHPKHHHGGDQGEGEHDRQNASRSKPRDLRKPRQRREEEHEEGEDVEIPLDDDGGRSLDSRAAAEGVQRHDAGGVAGAEWKHVVEELTHEKGLSRGPESGSAARGEEHAPALGADEEGEREQRERGYQRPVVAVAQRVAELAEVDVAHGEVREHDRDEGREHRRAVAHAVHGAQPLHCDRSVATQARL